MISNNIAVHASIDNRNIIEKIREEILKKNVIPDGYFIEMTGEKWISHFGSHEEANKMYKELVVETDSSTTNITDKLLTRAVNFHTLTENPELNTSEIVALEVWYGNECWINMRLLVNQYTSIMNIYYQSMNYPIL